MDREAYDRWNLETVLEEASKHNKIKYFEDSCKGAYVWAKRHNKLDEITSHMSKVIRWDYTSVKNEALKFNKLSKFATVSRGAYSWMLKNNFVDDFTKHMKKRDGA